MTKVIVTCRYNINTKTLCSIERISKSPEDAIAFLKRNQYCFGEVVTFAETLIDFLQGKFINGEEYLQKIIDSNNLGICYARMYSKFFEKDEGDYSYFMLKVQNVY